MCGATGWVHGNVGQRSNHGHAPTERVDVAPSAIALILVGLGDSRSAIAWLAKGYEARDLEVQVAAVNPLFESAHLPRSSR